MRVANLSPVPKGRVSYALSGEVSRFWCIKSPASKDDVDTRIEDLLRAVYVLFGHEPDSRMAASEDRSSDEPPNEQTAQGVLRAVLRRVCQCAEAVTCIIEPEHVDAAYSDLYSHVYVAEHFATPRRCVRVSIFACALDQETFLRRPGLKDSRLAPARQTGECLQESFVGSIVVTPRAGFLAGRTLLNPEWVVDGPARIGLTDIEQTVRGRKLMVPSFPWRQQDGEAMSCAETALLSISCYFSNEYNEYAVMMPSTMLEIIKEQSDVRVIPSQGRDSSSIACVLKHMGLRVRKYSNKSFMGRVVIGEPKYDDEALRRLVRVYVASGLPVAVNVQPEVGNVGHWVVVYGLAGREADGADWKSFGRYAESVSADSRSVEFIDACNLERKRQFVVSDDTQIPYRFASWGSLSSFRHMKPAELVVPTARKMELGALNARQLAGEVLRSPELGILSCAAEVPEERLVLTQQLVSVRNYLRMRCATCDPEVAQIYEEGVFPRFAWLFELVEAREWGKGPHERQAVAEVLLDATAQSQAFAEDRAALVRYPGFLCYRDVSGAQTLLRSGVARSFASFDGNLRVVVPRATAR